MREFGQAEKSLILLAGKDSGRFEGASPGDWMDYPEAHEDQWIFLAGDRSLVKKLGLKLGRTSRCIMEDEPGQDALFYLEGPDEDGCVWIN